MKRNVNKRFLKKKKIHVFIAVDIAEDGFRWKGFEYRPRQ